MALRECLPESRLVLYDGNMSNQVFGADKNLQGEGLFYGKRPAYLGLYIGNLELAAATPVYGGDVGTTATGINGATGGDPDSYIPKLEAAYKLGFGSFYIRPFAGFQWYRRWATAITMPRKPPVPPERRLLDRLRPGADHHGARRLRHSGSRLL
jgi:hypothetical protein